MTAKKVYLLSIVFVLLAAAYPVYMGAVMVLAYAQNGGIDVADYPSYIIPYTPICVALIICTALLPLVLNFAGGLRSRRGHLYNIDPAFAKEYEMIFFSV